jgi:hypothetical protein
MQLHVARLCLDCEEVHDARVCPRCTSETFAYLSRWIPAPERRARPRPPVETETSEPPRPPVPVVEEPVSPGRWLRRGAVLAALGVGGWIWSQKATKPSSRDEGSSLK